MLAEDIIDYYKDFNYKKNIQFWLIVLSSIEFTAWNCEWDQNEQKI